MTISETTLDTAGARLGDPLAFPGMPAAQPRPPQWSYDEAFCRNRGLITAEEQERLRRSRVAIIGMGGVGGIHLVTLARLGIGHFTIADPDTFELANFNRQYGALLGNLGRSKVEAMAQTARAINPEIDLCVLKAPVTQQNVDRFLAGADLLIDGVDFFSFQARRLVFRQARARNIWAITAGPVGFSVAWLVFDPRGMSFDKYFDIRDHMNWLDQLIAFAVGLAPRATHLRYLDLGQVDPAAGKAPSASLACHLAAGVAAAEALKILLGRGPLRPAPCYAQFDPYRGILRRGRLLLGNRHPWQRLKRYILRRRFAA